ncbi:hypothetical protein Tco_0841395 [Tanacetum coccineum]|uniref:Uncharacterized protein n=1 Tax=Tanacetum coccineum TaxID=301880 RepID=A0ABQ5B051_9ASTR
MMPKAKGLNVLSKVALTKDGKLKLATKKSKTQFYSSHRTGSGDGVDTQLEVPDEQHLKTTSADEGTEEDKNDENDSEDKSNGNDDDDTNDDDNQEGDDTNDNDEETDSDRTESDIIKILVLNQSTTEYYEEEEEKIDDEETIDDEEEDKVTKELYLICEVRFNDKVINLEKDLLEIKQVDQYAQAPSFISAIAHGEKNAYIELIDISMRAIIKEEVKTLTSLDSSSSSIRTFETSVIEKMYRIIRSCSLDKESKSHLRADYKKKLYDALFESYNTDKDLFNSYSEVFTLKRSQDDNDIDRDPLLDQNEGERWKIQAYKLRLSR